MALIVAESSITHIAEDSEAVFDAFNRVQKAVFANDRYWPGEAHYMRLPLRDEGGYSLLTHASPLEGMSMRFFPADGTDAAPQEGVTWLLCDSSNGRLLAVFGAELLSALRTAIPSVACARLLAKGKCRSIAIVGSGRQAQAHCRILRFAFPEAESLHLWSPNAERRRKLAEEARKWFDGTIVDSPSRNDATRAADLVFLLGPPDVLQIDEEAATENAVIVTVGNSVPTVLEDKAIVYVPTVAKMSDHGSTGQMGRSIVSSPHEEPGSDQRKILKLGGLYGWDALIARWAYDHSIKANLGVNISLD